MAKKYETDLSQGSVPKQLLKFALPFILSSLIQQFYSMADLVIVGQFSGTIGLAGVNGSQTILSLITNLALGFCVGASVLIGQYAGADDQDSLKKTIGNTCTFLIILAIVIMAGLLIFLNPLLNLINTPAESYAETQDYLRICAVGTIFIFGYNALSAFLRGMGDSKRPFWIVVVCCIINVFLDILFVGVFNMSAAGAAIATVMSQAASMIGCIILLKRSDFVFDFKLKSFAIDHELLSRILKVSAPIALQNVITSISFVFLTALSNSLGVIAIAATGSGGKLVGLGIMPSIAIGNAVAAMTAQNFGAGREDRAIETMKVGVIINLVLNVTLCLIVELFAAPLLSIFGNDPELIETGVRYLRTFSLDFLFVPFMGNFCALFNGAGHTVFSSILNMMSSLIVRIPICYLFGILLGLDVLGIGMGAPIASLLSGILSVAYFLSGKWRTPVTKK